MLDYDDLLLFWSEMLGQSGLAAEVGGAFDRVLVDEYQDTNQLQSAILRSLKSEGTGVTMLGDDAQSIYAFRGATVRNILDLPHQFGQPARSVTLEQNNRSTPPILAMSNAVIAAASERHAKTLWTERPGAQLPQLVTVPDAGPGQRSALGRRSHPAPPRVRPHTEIAGGPFPQFFAQRGAGTGADRRNVPFVKFGGLKFLGALHVKDLLANLRFLQNPHGLLAGLRTLQLMPGIGPVTATRVMEVIDQAADPREAVQAFEPPAAAAAERAGFVALFLTMHKPSGSATWPAEVGQAKRWYLPQLERLHDDAETRRADVENLERMAAGYADRERFLSELTLDPPEATSDQGGPAMPRRGLPDSVDHPFGQGPVMESRVRAACGRWLHARGSGHWHLCGVAGVLVVLHLLRRADECDVAHRTLVDLLDQIIALLHYALHRRALDALELDACQLHDLIYAPELAARLLEVVAERLCQLLIGSRARHLGQRAGHLLLGTVGVREFMNKQFGDGLDGYEKLLVGWFSVPLFQALDRGLGTHPDLAPERADIPAGAAVRLNALLPYCCYPQLTTYAAPPTVGRRPLGHGATHRGRGRLSPTHARIAGAHPRAWRGHRQSGRSDRRNGGHAAGLSSKARRAGESAR